MSASRSLTAPSAEAGDSLRFVDGVGGSLTICTFAVIVLAAVVFSRFEDGGKAFQRLVWLLDGMLGGAPHTVTLPGPPGLPLVGNLIQVSRD